MTITITPGDQIIKAWSFEEANFELQATSVEELISGEAEGETTIDDLVFDFQSFAVIDTNAQVSANIPTKEFIGYESSDESIATVDNSGKVTRVSDGTVRIFAQSHKMKKRVEVTVSREEYDDILTYNRFADGSLVKHMADAVDSRIAGKDLSALPMFSVQQHQAGNYVRNPNFWGADLDLTPISPWNSNGLNRKGGILVSPRHLFHAQHYGIHPGDTVRFVTMDNQVITMEVAQASRVGGTWSDMRLLSFTEDVPSSISYCKVLPPDWEDYMPGFVRGVPGLAPNRFEEGSVREFFDVWTNDLRYAVWRESEEEQRALFWKEMVGGDSGNPAMVIINNELVPICCWHGPGGGPAIMEFHDVINAKMDEWNPGYSLTSIDLSDFPNYAE